MDGIAHGVPLGDHRHSVAKLDEVSRSRFLVIIYSDAAAPKRMATRKHETHCWHPIAGRHAGPLRY